MKLVVLDGYALNPGDLSWSCLERFGSVTVYDRTPDAEIIPRIGDAEIVLLNKTPITAATIAACPSVRLICVLATGYNVVDCAAARAHGISVCNVPGYATEEVAQFTFALLLELCHHVGLHSDAVHAGKWESCPDFCFFDTPQRSLRGKTMGIIGFGAIGRATGRIARAMGMRVLAYNRSRCPEGEAIAQYVDLDTLLAESDVISLHCPLTPETTRIIHAGTIAKMKDGALLINTARGAVLDDAAVAAALTSGKLGGAALDVLTEEPPRSGSPLLTAPNCIITPHIAWTAAACRQRILDCTVQSIVAFENGHPVNTVN